MAAKVEAGYGVDQWNHGVKQPEGGAGEALVIVDVAGKKTGNQKSRQNFGPKTDHEGDGESGWRVPSADIGPELEIDGGAIEKNVEEDGEKAKEEAAEMGRGRICSTLKHAARNVLQRGREGLVPFRAIVFDEVLASHESSVNC